MSYRATVEPQNYKSTELPNNNGATLKLIFLNTFLQPTSKVEIKNFIRRSHIYTHDFSSVNILLVFSVLWQNGL